MIEIVVPTAESTARIITELVASGVEIFAVTPTAAGLEGLYATSVESPKG